MSTEILRYDNQEWRKQSGYTKWYSRRCRHHRQESDRSDTTDLIRGLSQQEDIIVPLTKEEKVLPLHTEDWLEKGTIFFIRIHILVCVCVLTPTFYRYTHGGIRGIISWSEIPWSLSFDHSMDLEVVWIHTHTYI